MFLLQTRLDGTNEIVEVPDKTVDAPGVKKFADFLKEIGLCSHSGVAELAQVLKVPVEKMEKLSDGGLIEGPSQESIRYYVRNCRLSENSLRFLQGSQGEAGTKNRPESD